MDDYNKSSDMVAIAESDSGSEYEHEIEQRKIMAEQSSYYDDMGDEWITFKQAERKYGKSRSTIKRRVEDNDIEVIKREMSCGVTHFVRASDMDRIMSNDDLKAVVRSSKNKNFNTLLANFLDQYESRVLAPLDNKLESIYQSQDDMMKLQKEIVDKFEQLSKENEELKDIISSISSSIEEQQGSARTESKSEYDKLSAQNEELRKIIEELNQKVNEQQDFIEGEREKAEKKKKGLFGFLKKDK